MPAGPVCPHHPVLAYTVCPGLGSIRTFLRPPSLLLVALSWRRIDGEPEAADMGRGGVESKPLLGPRGGRPDGLVGATIGTRGWSTSICAPLH